MGVLWGCVGWGGDFCIPHLLWGRMPPQDDTPTARVIQTQNTHDQVSQQYVTWTEAHGQSKASRLLFKPVACAINKRKLGLMFVCVEVVPMWRFSFGRGDMFHYRIMVTILGKSIGLPNEDNSLLGHCVWDCASCYLWFLVCWWRRQIN